jgi:hypothetical protein
MRKNPFIVAWVFGVALAACSSSSDGQSVKDQAGRTCTIPSTGMTLSCNAAPMPHAACTGGATACFVKGVADTTTPAQIGPSAICAACCNGNSATSTGGDCSPIVCKTVDDCPHGDTRCEGGACY